MTTFEGLSPASDQEFRIATGTFDLAFLPPRASGFTCALETESGLQVLLELYDPEGELRMQIIRYKGGRSPKARVLRDPAGTSLNARPGAFPPGSWRYHLAARNVSALGETGPCEHRWSFTLAAVEPGEAKCAPRTDDFPDQDASATMERSACAANAAGLTDSSYGTEWGGVRWYAGDLHQHTTLSDGLLEPDRLIRANAARGHAFMAITDHQVFQPRRDLPELLVLGGTEVTTPSGHFLRLGDAPASGLLPDAPGEVFGDCADLHRLCRRFHDEGAFLVVCHPVFPPWHWRCEPLSGYPFDAMEILCDPTHPRAAVAADAALTLWNALLDAGRRTVGIGGSDFHGPLEDPENSGEPHGRPGDPTTFLAGPLRLEPGQSVPDSLRDGRVAVGRGFLPGLLAVHAGREYLPGDTIELPTADADASVRIRAAIVLLGAEDSPDACDRTFHCSIAGSGGTEDRFDVHAGPPVSRTFLPADRPEGWFRLDVRDGTGTLCGFTNPIRWRRTEGRRP
jgi:hypothetical protein